MSVTFKKKKDNENVVGVYEMDEGATGLISASGAYDNTPVMKCDDRLQMLDKSDYWGLSCSLKVRLCDFKLTEV